MQAREPSRSSTRGVTSGMANCASCSWTTQPLPAVPAGPFGATHEEPQDPQHQQDAGDDPQGVVREPKPAEQQRQQEYQQDETHGSFPSFVCYCFVGSLPTGGDFSRAASTVRALSAVSRTLPPGTKCVKRTKCCWRSRTPRRRSWPTVC